MPQGFEIDFLAVGENSCSGDAICVRYGSAQSGYNINIVDGGFKSTASTILAHLNHEYGTPARINNVVVTHPHADHVGGLADVLEAYAVDALWMHRPWLYAAEIIGNFHGNWTVPGLVQHFRDEFPALVELETIAIRKRIPILEPFQGAAIGQFRVLAPSRSRYLNLLPQFDKSPDAFPKVAVGWVERLVKKAVSWVQETWTGETLSENPEPTDAVNESSVVQAAFIEERLIVLTSDVGPSGLLEAAAYLGKFGTFQPYFFQVPHHGSRRNVTPTALNQWLGSPVANGTERGRAYCSAAKEDEDHPRKKVVNAFLRRGYPVHVTNGIARCCRFNMPARNGWDPGYPEPFSPEVEE